MKRLHLFLFITILTTIPLLAKTTNSKRSPIIDMHLHAQKVIWMKNLPRYPEVTGGPKTKIQDISELLPRTVEEMKKYNTYLHIFWVIYICTCLKKKKLFLYDLEAQ